MSLTVGEHDSMWKNVFGRSIPNISENLGILTNQIGYRNQFEILKELHEGKIITDESYYKVVLKIGRAVKLIDEKELKDLSDEVDKLYGENEP